MDDIVHLDKTIKKYGHDKTRELYQSEILDKINYVSILKDEFILAACYTHPEIINAICGKNVPRSSELTWWTGCGTFTTLPSKVQNRIIASVMQNVGYGAAQKLIAETCYNMPISQVKITKENELTL